MAAAQLLAALPFRIDSVRDGTSSYEVDSWDLETQALALEETERPVRTGTGLNKISRNSF